MRYAHGESNAHGAWGETSLFPPWARFSPVCYMEACDTQCVLEVTALAPAPAATGRLKCSVTAWCRCHVVGCRAYALSSLPPPLCSGVASPVLKRSGSTVTCLRVLPAPCALGTHGLAPCVRVCTGMFCPCIWRLESPQRSKARIHPPEKKRELIVCEAISSQ